MDGPEQSQQRVMRVFVSSTFRDMAAERDELVKRVFPQLAALCRDRDVVWGEVDLRWGITDEQAAEGKVLPICLSEIDRCRPYFVGLLGERYGWIPEQVDRDVAAREPWLLEHLDRSVTELEILHGVLNEPAMADRAFFYFRDPAYAHSRPGFVEGPDPDELARMGEHEAQRLAERRVAKLATLKRRIVESRLPVREGYRDPRELGDLVLADLSDVINRLFPAGEKSDPQEDEAAAHAAYARSRAAVYLGRPDYIDRLDAHVAVDGAPLVVSGEPGSGKSALLANWGLERLQVATDDELMLMWFVGASPASADWQQMLRWMLRQLERRLQLGIDVPSEPAALRAAFASALAAGSQHIRIVLLIDGVNQLEDRDGALELAWLPSPLMNNVRVVLSTLPGPSYSELQRRQCHLLTVQSLDTTERERLIIAYLAQYTKALAADDLGRIAAAPPCSNPLFLRTMLDELRIAADHETLRDRVTFYTRASGVAELYEMVLDRYEADYERDRAGLVGDAMRFVWAARRGLSHAELLDLLGDSAQPLAAGILAPLIYAAAENLVDRSGLIDFAHDQLRDAVHRRYLADPSIGHATRLRLARYFAEHGATPRSVDELPWQLAQAAEWDQLATVLADESFLVALDAAAPHDLRASWVQLASASTHTKVDCYKPILDDPGLHTSDVIGAVSRLLESTGDGMRALPLIAELSDRARPGDHRSLYSELLRRQAGIVAAIGDRAGAAALQEEAAATSHAGTHPGLEETEWRFSQMPTSTVRFGPVGHAFFVTNGNEDTGNWDLEDATVTFARRASLSQLINPSQLDEVPVYVGQVEGDVITGCWTSPSRRDRSSVVRLERVTTQDADESVSGPAAVAASLLARARDRGDELGLEDAREAERVYRELGMPSGVAEALTVQAQIQQRQGEYQREIALLIEVERIYREVEQPEPLIRTLHAHRTALDALAGSGASEPVEHLDRLTRHIRQELAEENTGESRALYKNAIRAEARGDIDEALALYGQAQQEAPVLIRVRCLHRQALIHKRRRELDPARALAREALRDASVEEFTTMQRVLTDLLADLGGDPWAGPDAVLAGGPGPTVMPSTGDGADFALEGSGWREREVTQFTVRFDAGNVVRFYLSERPSDVGKWHRDGATLTIVTHEQYESTFVGHIEGDVITGSWGSGGTHTVHLDRAPEVGDSAGAVQGEVSVSAIEPLLRQGRCRDAAEMIADGRYLRMRLQPATSDEDDFIRARHELRADVVALAIAWPPAESAGAFVSMISALVGFGFEIFNSVSNAAGKGMLTTAVRAAGQAALFNPELVDGYIAACNQLRGFLDSPALWGGPGGDRTGTELENAVMEAFPELRERAAPEFLEWFAQWDAYWQQRE